MLGVANSLLTIPVIVAEEQGFLRDAGLDVTTKRLPSGKAALDALLRGKVEAWATVAETPIPDCQLAATRFHRGRQLCFQR